MTCEKSASAMATLQNNAENFFTAHHERFQTSMQCSKACQKCCHVSLSVFEAEASLILDWYTQLTEEQQLKIMNVWSAERERTSAHPAKKVCSFLTQEGCSIYPVRPTICRTQGAALRYKISSNSKGDTDFSFDSCNLNFTEPESFPEPKDCLDIDRLNTLLSIAEQHFQSQKTNKSLETIRDKEGRIPLSKLQNFLIQLSSKEKV